MFFAGTRTATSEALSLVVGEGGDVLNGGGGGGVGVAEIHGV